MRTETPAQKAATILHHIVSEEILKRAPVKKWELVTWLDESQEYFLAQVSLRNTDIKTHELRIKLTADPMDLENGVAARSMAAALANEIKELTKGGE